MSAIVGLAQVLRALENEAKKGGGYQDAVNAAVYQEGLEIIGVAVLRTPVDFNILRKSHYVAPPDSNGVVKLGFGADYAAAVHDRVEVYHEVGGPLYLKSAVDEAQVGYVDRIAKRAAKNYKAGIGVKSIPATAPTRPKTGGK